MLRFAKPDGSPFDLDYVGDIHVFDSGNSRIALCKASSHLEKIYFNDELRYGLEIRAQPEDWDCWEILIDISDFNILILQRATASAWAAITLVERLSVGEDNA